jgi:hypothetical protein
MDKLKQGQGKVVTGDLFYDREKDKELFIDKIDEGAHILLVAQRRMGKTSLMAEVAEKIGDKYICIFVDLQGAKNSCDAVTALSLNSKKYQSIWKRTTDVFSNVLDNIEEIKVGDLGAKIRGGLTAGNWMTKGDQLFDILADAEKPVVLLLDEVPIMINRMLKDDNYVITRERKDLADEFMSWIRKNAIKHQGEVRIVITGSIGLEPVLRQAGLSATINNFVAFELKPWNDDTAEKCLNALANEYGVEFQEGVTKEMVSRLGCCIPHHVQMFFTHIHDRCKRKGSMVCSITDVEEVYERDMLGVRGHAELTHYEERLKQVLGEEVLPLALEMVTEAAVTGVLSREAIEAFQKEYTFPGSETMEVMKEILWVLEHDGYLAQNTEGYIFVSKLLRDWWKKGHKNFYTPILERGV